MKFISVVIIFAIFAHAKRLDVLDAIQVENDSHERRSIDVGELFQTVELQMADQNLPAPIVLRFCWSRATLNFGDGTGNFQLAVMPAGDQFLEVRGSGDHDVPGADYLNVDIGQMTAVLEYERGTGRLLSFDPDSGPNRSIEITDSENFSVFWVTPTVTIVDGIPTAPG